MVSQLSQLAKLSLEKQQYRVVGSHSAVKICHWAKSMLRNRGGCYKHVFYGINSCQCMQLTTSLSCANRCIFCWRDYKSPVSKEWKWDFDKPELILDNCIKAHQKLLVGFKGYDKRNKAAYELSNKVRHVALSLSGEPIIYPKINEFIKLCHKKGLSTFLVTNAQYPEQLKKLVPVTQLYISLDAPNKELLKKIDLPLFSDYWERLNKSLELMARKKHRTAIRLTIIKGVNDIEPENYAALIKKASPGFVEVKAYMYVGASMKRLKRENMPEHQDIVAFSKQLAKFLPGYEIASEHYPSRVVLLANKRFKVKGKWKIGIEL